MRRNPYSIVCFDNVDKAHTDVFGLILQILEEGTLTDGRGRITDFSGTIIIFTVSSDCKTHTVSGFGRDGQQNAVPVISTALTERIDKAIEFEPLDDNALSDIINKRLFKIKTGLKIPFSYTDNVCEALIKKCDRSQNGHGALKAVEKYIEEPLSYLLLESGVCGINVNSDKKDIQITSVKSLDKTALTEYN